MMMKNVASKSNLVLVDSIFHDLPRRFQLYYCVFNSCYVYVKVVSDHKTSQVYKLSYHAMFRVPGLSFLSLFFLLLAFLLLQGYSMLKDTFAKKSTTPSYFFGKLFLRSFPLLICTWFLKNQVWQTGFLVYFELEFYCLCSLQKSIPKLIFAG